MLLSPNLQFAKKSPYVIPSKRESEVWRKPETQLNGNTKFSERQINSYA